jgi:hypothetical protein
MSCVQGAAVVDVASYSCRVTTACSELDHHKVHAPSRHHSVEVSGCALKFRRPVADAGRYVPVSAIRALALGVLVAVSAIVRSQDSVIANPELRQELLAMRAEDQRVRLEFQDLSASEQRAVRIGDTDMSVVDRENTKRLKAIVSRYGWPTISLVGKDGSISAFLLIQHADQDRAFQRQVLALMEPLVQSGEVSASNYAYLYDRVSTPQRYGTQGRCNGPNRWDPNDIEDPETVDARRASVGIVPSKISEYKSIMDAVCK